MTTEERIKKALEIACRYGGIEGDHHKAWVIDQMTRALTDCPVVKKLATDIVGTPYTYNQMIEGEEYQRLVANCRDGEDGPETYDWNIGIAP